MPKGKAASSSDSNSPLRPPTSLEAQVFCESCVLQDVSISMKVSGIHSGYFASDQKWIGYTTLAHLVAERCVIPRKMLNS